MPYKIRKLRGKDLYQLKNVETGKIHSKYSTKKDAEKQLRLLNAIEFKKYTDTLIFPINPFPDGLKAFVS